MAANLQGRVALVTGGGRGIGRAICLMLAREGARVAINYQSNDAAARETLAQVEQAGAEGMLARGDVTNEAEVTAMVAAVRARWQGVELLVNNAGIAENLPHDQLTFARWRRVFAVNVDGVFLTTWAVKDDMLARGYGRIVNISSLAGFVKKPDMIHYAAAKATVIALTRSCSEAFAPRQVRVNCVAPGLTETDITRQSDQALVARLIQATPLGRIGQPDEIALAVRFFLGDESNFITGQTLPVCGGRV